MSVKPVPTVVYPADGPKDPRKRPLPLTLYNPDGTPLDFEDTPRVIVGRDSDLIVPASTYTLVDWEFVEERSPSSMWSPAAPSRLVASEPGVYRGMANLSFQVGQGTRRIGFLRLNGGDQVASASSPSVPADIIPVRDLVMMPGDYLETQVWHDYAGNNRILYGSTTARRFAPRMSLMKIGSVPYKNRLVTLGDSLSDGEAPTNAYVGELMPILPTTHIMPRGVAGETSAQIAARVQKDVVLHRPDVAVVLMGTNSIGQGVSVASVQADITSVINACAAAAIDVVLMTLPPFGNNATYAPNEANRVALNDWIKTRSVAAVLDTNPLLWNPADHSKINPGYDYGDGLHLNPTGEQILAQAIADVFNDIV